jgi:hypothetical protein
MRIQTVSNKYYYHQRKKCAKRNTKIGLKEVSTDDVDYIFLDENVSLKKERINGKM